MTHIRRFTCFKMGFKLNLNFDVSDIEPQGIRIKGRVMALVWYEKASLTALQTSSLFIVNYN